MPKKRTKYSDYFDTVKDKATCRRCGKVIQCTNGQTSGMNYHITKVHNINLSDAENAEPEEKISKPNSTLDGFVRVKKPPLEEIISKEAAKGVSFEYLATSDLIHRGVRSYGYEPPKSHNTVRSLVKRSAENHRKIYRDKFQELRKNGQRFCTIADEWTCPAKKRKYLNIILHLKGILNLTKYYLPKCLADNTKMIILARNLTM